MKRLFVRASILVVVLVLGGFAIAHAQRSTSPSNDDETATSAAGQGSDAGAPGRLPAIGDANPLRSPEGPSPRRMASASEKIAENQSNVLRSPKGRTPAAASLRAVAWDEDVPAKDPFLGAGKPKADSQSQANPVRQTREQPLRPAAPPPRLADASGASMQPGSRGPSSPSGQPRPIDAEAADRLPRIGTVPATPADRSTSTPKPFNTAAARPSIALPGLEPANARASEANLGKTAMSHGMATVAAEKQGSNGAFLGRPTAAIGNAAEPGRLPNSPPQELRLAGNPAAYAKPRPMSLGEPGGFEARGGEPDRIGEGTGKPGAQQLEGPQVPQLTLQKVAPADVQVGKKATFLVKLKNTGGVVAHNVEIRDDIPKGARMVNTNPRASRGVRGELVWSLGSVRPGEEVTVEEELMPIAEGEIGSVATVGFHTEASARVTATKPQLALKVASPNRVLVGEDATFTITVSNPGSGVAQNVVLDNRVPPSFKHALGGKIEYSIGDLKPNESRTIELKLGAAQAGQVVNLLIARAEGDLRAEERTPIEVLAPSLEVAVEGPKRRFLDREATYTLLVSNPGTAPAKQIELVAHLPTGLKFVSANNAGQYNEASRSVHWLLEELPNRETGKVELTTMPVEPGQQVLRLRGSAQTGLSSEKEQPVLIEGISAILFEVADTKDPIEVNGETTYEVKVVNQGSKAARNVQIVAHLPAELKALAVEGPTQGSIEGNQVVFNPLASLAPKANTVYRIRVQGLRAGDQRIRVQLLTDEIRTPITKEESTHVYADE
jgi:uncharacterized repeat protein (TIGR01451 family)